MVIISSINQLKLLVSTHPLLTKPTMRYRISLLLVDRRNNMSQVFERNYTTITATVGGMLPKCMPRAWRFSFLEPD